MQVVPEESAPTLARCAAVVARAVVGHIDEADLPPTVTALMSLPEDTPRRGPLAGNLLVALLRSNPEEVNNRSGLVSPLLSMADRDPPLVPDWPRMRAVARAVVLLRDVCAAPEPDVPAALREFETLEEIAGDEPGAAKVFAFVRNGLAHIPALQQGDGSALAGVIDAMTEVGGPSMSGHLATVSLMKEAMDALGRGDHSAVARAVADASAAARSLPQGDRLRDAMEQTVTMMGALGFMPGGSIGQPSPEGLDALQRLMMQPGMDRSSQAMAEAALGGALLRGGEETDLGRIDQGIAHFRRALEVAGAADPQRAFYLTSVALGLYRRCEVTGHRDGLAEAKALLEEARTLIGGPHHPQWTLVNEMLAGIQRRTGETMFARDFGLDALRSYAWRVLQHTDTATARAAVRDAARDAVDLARQCLADGRPEEALRALDAGRGLLLFGAAERRDLASWIAELDRPDLLDRWHRAVTAVGHDHVPTELRGEILTALAQRADSLAALLDPPSLAEVQEALHTLAADALVYLVPGQRPIPGYAVIAPASGGPSYFALPELVLDREVDVERYLRALANRDLDVTDDDETRDLQARPRDSMDLAASLDDLCDWAWRAAIGPLLDRYLRPATGGRVPHVVLIPMGDLSRIPWQAARRADGRYAVQEVAFSQTASARLLCQVAARTPVAVSPVGLVVADPQSARDKPLPAARVEASQIHHAFYPGARYLGRRPDGSHSSSGTGSAADLRSWLAATSVGAGTMLHLACHAVADLRSGTPRSYLVLAGTDLLDADEVLSRMTAARPIGLVVLAACNSGTSVHGYDEAYSLGTAFLAGGARTVLSTQWSIPDRATSALMYLFHHYLRVEAMPAWQALREAQLRMLEPPQRWPERLRTVAGDSSSQVVAWAGFVHFGQ